ncbi:hypothetical protein [Roseivirga misakiensis]|uniref:Thiamine pyrophosphokinase n=1 Tax=Roseivirga misakiensis TaxID=1563681 RepID=A0A1E5T389_9BACT|nr:hypothetical protein [Roseivirga misakiensis]OEK05853.1 hypothetical protein BFP71_06970 [Roseivirga misakiensis]
MSSHHIVRDEQEPALLIDDATSLSTEFIDLLLEWSPTIIVTKYALNEVLTWGIKIDVVVAQFDDIEELKPKLKPQSPVQLLGFESPDLLSCAYIFLNDQKHTAVNVVAKLYDSRALDLAKEYIETIDTVIYYNDKKWVFEPHGKFEKWVTAGRLFGIHPVAQNTFFSSEGFFADWQNEILLEPIELTSQVSGKVKLWTNNKPLWVVEDVQTDIYH